jgi:hypothetical protein
VGGNTVDGITMCGGRTVGREDSREGGQWGVVRTEGREDSKSWWDSGEGGWRGMVGLWGGRTMVYGVTVGREDSGTC